MTPTLPQLIACAERQVALRKNVYPKWIGTKLTADKARHEIACMEGIVAFLKAVAPDPSKVAETIGDLFAREALKDYHQRHPEA